MGVETLGEAYAAGWRVLARCAGRGRIEGLKSSYQAVDILPPTKWEPTNAKLLQPRMAIRVKVRTRFPESQSRQKFLNRPDASAV
jgi:hypothetical protein